MLQFVAVFHGCQWVSPKEQYCSAGRVTAFSFLHLYQVTLTIEAWIETSKETVPRCRNAHGDACAVLTDIWSMHILKFGAGLWIIFSFDLCGEWPRLPDESRWNTGVLTSSPATYLHGWLHTAWKHHVSQRRYFELFVLRIVVFMVCHISYIFILILLLLFFTWGGDASSWMIMWKAHLWKIWHIYCYY